MRSKVFVQCIEHFREFERCRFFRFLRKRLPKIAQYLLPFEAPAGNIVELFFKRGRKAVLDIAFEKAGEECGDQPAPILRDKLTALQAHVIPVLQNL